MDKPLKPPGRKWAKALENRHPVLKARRAKAFNWNRHEKNAYKKIMHWLEVIGKVDSARGSVAQIQVAEEAAPEPWRALVARMW